MPFNIWKVGSLLASTLFVSPLCNAAESYLSYKTWLSKVAIVTIQ